MANKTSSSSMTLRERHLTILRGGVPDRIPWNCYGWIVPQTPVGRELVRKGLGLMGTRRIYTAIHDDVTIRTDRYVRRWGAPRTRQYRNPTWHSDRRCHHRIRLRQPLDQEIFHYRRAGLPGRRIFFPPHALRTGFRALAPGGYRAGRGWLYRRRDHAHPTDDFDG